MAEEKLQLEATEVEFDLDAKYPKPLADEAAELVRIAVRVAYYSAKNPNLVLADLETNHRATVKKEKI